MSIARADGEPMSNLTFIIGGARSGKSTHAERLAAQYGPRVLYVATAEALDEEMQRRVAAHQRNRPKAWQTCELSAGVGRQLLAEPPRVDVILLDCLTLLVSNLVLQASPDADHPDEAAAAKLVRTEVQELLDAVEAIQSRWLVVSNEVGQGLVPPYPLGRVYRDLLGWANQRCAQAAKEVIWMVAGIPVPIGEHRNS
jgi:adenosylcobinamide kinase / adenosylcobinamide-phosphate guanylyltransferase